MQPLLESSLALFHELIARESLDCEWQTRGLLFVYKSADEMQAYAATDRLLTDEFHCPAKRYAGDEVVALEPALREGLAGGWHYEEDGHLRPDRLLRQRRSRSCKHRRLAELVAQLVDLRPGAPVVVEQGRAQRLDQRD